MSGSVSHLGGARVLVLGDVMLDRFLQGTVGRISPEAPVPVVSLTGETRCLGGSGNVAAGIAALGGRAALAGAVGADPEGHQVRTLLRAAGIDDALLVEHSGVQTICKTRILAGNHQQLLRLDQDGRREAAEAAAEQLAQRLIAAIAGQEAVVLADYDKGHLPAALVQRVLHECRARGVPAIVDPKKADFSAYAGATLLTPNLAELERAVGRSLEGQEPIAEAAHDLRRRLGLDQMLVTLGPRGMLLADAGGTTHVPAEVREVADVTGAGDTVVAVLALALARRWPLGEACRLASLAAGIAVGKPRTYVVQAAELDQLWQGRSLKVLDRTAAAARVAQARRAGQTIVFTNGCFDILHAGHLACLEGARKLGDLLVLGLNSDASVRALKGPTRPAIDQEHRAALLAGLACVDLVVIFDEPTPESLIRAIEPDVLVKGGDYDPATIVGADFVRGRGGRVVTLPLVDGLSTTGILQAAARQDV